MGMAANGHGQDGHGLSSDCADVGTAAYRLLTGCDPADAAVEDDAGFDRHVLASILAVAAMEGGVVAERAGLANNDLVKLIEQQFPDATDVSASWCAQPEKSEDEETAMVARDGAESSVGRSRAARS
jgi:nitrogen fixation protein NifQ